MNEVEAGLVALTANVLDVHHQRQTSALCRAQVLCMWVNPPLSRPYPLSQRLKIRSLRSRGAMSSHLSQ